MAPFVLGRDLMDRDANQRERSRRLCQVRAFRPPTSRGRYRNRCGCCDSFRHPSRAGGSSGGARSPPRRSPTTHARPRSWCRAVADGLLARIRGLLRPARWDSTTRSGSLGKSRRSRRGALRGPRLRSTLTASVTLPNAVRMLRALRITTRLRRGSPSANIPSATSPSFATAPRSASCGERGARVGAEGDARIRARQRTSSASRVLGRVDPYFRRLAWSDRCEGCSLQAHARDSGLAAAAAPSRGAAIPNGCRATSRLRTSWEHDIPHVASTDRDRPALGAHRRPD